jgi:cytochrome c oxidase subunit IV
MNDREFKRHGRHLFIAWVALILLMLSSLASSYLSLGAWNGIIGLVIAIIKSAIVVGLFMGIARAGAALRIVAAAALGTWLVMLGLVGLDETHRPVATSTVQPPQQQFPGAAVGRR